ncbi:MULTISPECIES: hypothetical protein [unclassified Burkholderia]|uniref:hypothetical protein n=1 Tax=unclassified Burkholderia TaxID=2613784 RepID=UPI000F5E5AB4|nr:MULTISPECIES: hypothetical protein [unclassified Burkholderia]
MIAIHEWSVKAIAIGLKYRLTKSTDCGTIVLTVYGGARARNPKLQMVSRCVLLLIVMATLKCVAIGFPSFDIFNIIHTIKEMTMETYTFEVAGAVKVVVEIACEIGFATAAHLIAEGSAPHLQRKPD